jgi:DNA-binding transcriptional LysR family regulator
MDAGDLRIFEAVARLGGMNRAAQELNTVQSNVTARIRQLEDELGTALFQRHSRGVALTAAGKRLVPHAARVRRALEDARRAVADDGTPKGLLSLGTLETTAALRLSPALAAFAGRYPDVELALRTGTTCELIDDVLERRVDGAFVCGPVNHPDLAEEVVFREELAILTAPGIASAEKLLRTGEVKIVVLRTGCSYRQRFEDLLARRGVAVVRRLEFGTVEAILGCVAAGIGIALLPKALIGAVWPLGRVRVHSLPRTISHVETVFVRRRDAFVPTALAAFLDQVRPAARATAAAE